MKRILMTVAIATAFTALPTMASSFSSSSLSNYQVSLVDLKLNDGITPSIQISDSNSNSIDLVVFNAGTNVGDNVYKQLTLSGTGIVPTFVTRTYTTNTASASITGESIYEREIQVSTTTLGDSQRGSQSISFNKFNFTLSPYTQLTVNADANQYAEIINDPQNNLQRATSYADLVISDGFKTIERDYNFIYTAFSDSAGSVNLSDYALLSILFQNNSGREFSGFINSTIFSQTNSYNVENVSSVPVPAALPLMASAVGLFGLGAKRRKALKA